LGVAAVDAAGNVSGTATLGQSTSACSGPPPPANLSVSGVGQTSMTLSWTASTGATSYRTFLNGVQVGTPTTTSYAFSGLSCQTSYTLGVEAVDSGGNVSTLATTPGQTAACPSGSANVYVAQSAAGSGDGSSCANARPVSFFNSSSNWGAGKAIAPGSVVGLCGTITSALTLAGSGTAGSPVTVLWLPGASLAVCSTAGALQMNGQSFVTVDLGGNVAAITCPNNGTGLGSQLDAMGITGVFHNSRITDGTIGPVYQRAPHGSDSGGDGMGSECIYTSPGTSSNRIDHLTFTGCAYGLEYVMGAGVSSSGDEIDHNTFLDTVGTDIRYETADNSSMTASGSIHDNDISYGARWAVSSSYEHYDGIMIYNHGGGGNDKIDPVLVYDNYLHGTIYNPNTAAMFLPEGLSSCTSGSYTRAYIFDNLITLQGGDGFSDAFIFSHDCEHTIGVYNNTIDGQNNTTSVCVDMDGSPNTDTFANNICENVDAMVLNFQNPGPTMLFDYNDYANVGTVGNSGWMWRGTDYSTFSAWKTASGQDAHSTTASPGLNADYTVAGTGSAVYRAGENLTSLCTGALTVLCTSRDGNQRPTSGGWDIGAYSAP
jgi:hypothetical protein